MNMRRRVWDWALQKKWRRIGFHAVFGAAIAATWIIVVAVIAYFGNAAPSAWYGFATAFGAYGWREIDDVVIKGQGTAIAWAEVVAPVIAAGMVCAVLG